MTDFLSNLLVALILAALSTVTYVAYRHPGGYKKIYTSANIGIASLLGAFSVLWLGNWLDFVIGLDNSLKEDVISDEKILDIVKTAVPILRKQAGYLVILFIVGGMLFGYLSFLTKLPGILSEQTPSKEEAE